MKSAWIGALLLLALPDLPGGEVKAPLGWPMRSHDQRRTGRADVNGPRKGDKVWTYAARGGNAINMEPAAVESGVYFGTWGLTRKLGADQAAWNKFDGRIYGLVPATGKERFAPLMPAVTPYAYVYAKRTPGPQDRPAGEGRHLNWYNGTVEGTPLVDSRDGTLYVGRGDGKLFAVDPARGTVKWQFTTLDPRRPDDPEGGGEIVGGALPAPGGLIVFATFAAPEHPDPPAKVRHETNAVYAVDRAGRLVWRYPKEGTLEQPFSAPAALSPDGSRVYAATALPDGKHPCALLALEAATGRLIWQMEWMDNGVHDLAVGADGTIFCAGMKRALLVPRPAAWAVRDKGSAGAISWGPVELDPANEGTHWAGGLALLEMQGAVAQLFLSTTAMRMANSRGGRLHRLDSVSGKVLATWDPKEAEPACTGGLTDVALDREGVVYVGVRGRRPALGNQAVPGRMYALRSVDKGFDVLWSYQVRDQLDWASPAIGPQGGLYFGSSSAIGPLQHVLPHAPDAEVPDADPVFYGIRD